MGDNAVNALFRHLYKLEAMPTEKQLKVLWLLVLGVFADVESLKELLAGREADENSALHQALEHKLTKIFEAD